MISFFCRSGNNKIELNKLYQQYVSITLIIVYYESARILAVETFPAKSHWNFMSAVLQTLTNNGHNVTVFTPFPDGNRENYTEIDLSSEMMPKMSLNLVDIRSLFSNQLKPIFFILTFSRDNCRILLENKHLNEILTNNIRSNFDLIIIEPDMIGSCATIVAAGSDLPLIFTNPFPISLTTDRIVLGDVENPASVASLLAHFAVPKIFVQKFSNTIIFLFRNFVITSYEFIIKTIEWKPYDLISPVSPSLVFMNSHFITDFSRPLSSNVINIGGIHLKPHKKIPKDILEFIEDSPNGVILFTFGSTISIKSIPENIKNAFLNALAQLPQKVLLKYEDQLENKPKNIMTKKWFPQRDILMHPNVKLFISHGGISGLYEAVDAGVPVLGFPVFSDQHRNIDHLVEAGMAISMEIFAVTQDMFFNNIIEIINNKKYKINAKIASDIFKDRPMSPDKAVVYWTEYVIRHKGAPHLKSHAFNLTWYQYFLLDIIAVMLVLFFIVSFLIYRIFSIIYNYKYLSI